MNEFLNRLGIIGVSLVAGALIFGGITGGILVYGLDKLPRHQAAAVQEQRGTQQSGDQQDQQGDQRDQQGDHADKPAAKTSPEPKEKPESTPPKKKGAPAPSKQTPDKD